MGSKTPTPSKPSQDAQDENNIGRPASAAELQHSRLLGRIADALQVPPAALYQPPNAVTPARGTDSDGATDLDRDCAALLRAFRRIDDPERRHSVLRLVQAAAEQI